MKNWKKKKRKETPPWLYWKDYFLNLQHWNDKNAILALHSVGMACRRTLKTRCRVEDLLPGRFLQEDYIFPMPRHRWRWSENQGENLSSPPRLNDETELGVISRSERALAFAIQADGLSWMGSRRIPLPKTQDIMRNQVHNQGAITLWMRTHWGGVHESWL